MTLAPGDVVIDGLASGFAADAQGDPWFHVRVGDYATADGVVKHTPDGGLHVAARNGSTGDPAFTSSLAPESANGGIPAANDHPKWLAYMNRLSPSGFPGFDASAGTGLAATVRIAGRTFGTAQHPFGAAVPDPQTDPRLAAFAMTAIDIQSWMVFDFFFTNRRVYAFYERLPFGRTEGSGYAAFSYAVPVVDREPGDVHEATIAVDAASGVVRWILDGVDVYRVERSGHHLPDREHLLIDLGGEAQAVRPRQLAFGMGLFTLLDGALGDGPGLVRLSDRETYLRPRGDGRRAQSFVDEHSREASRLFGQGAEMTIASYTVHLTRSL